MSGALCDALRDIRIDLGVSLGSLKIDALLLGHLLEARALPLWEPSLVVRLGTRVFRIKSLGVADVSLSLPCRHEYLSAILRLMNHIFGLLFLALLWHAVLDQLLHELIISIKHSRKSELKFHGLL